MIVLDLLPADELQTGIGLLRHFQDRLPPHLYRYVAYQKIQTEADLDCFLFHIRSQARLGCKPIIHIECHGDERKGLTLPGSRSHFKWERLLQQLQKINFLAHNNVVLFLSGCYGAGILHALDIARPSPFLALIAADEEVSAGFIQDKIGHFYEKLLSSKEGFASAATIIAPSFKVLHSELIFAKAFSLYLRNYDNGKARQKRLDALLTYVNPNNNARPMVRTAMRAILKDQRGAFERLGKTFLHSKAKFSFEDFLRAHVGDA